MNEGEKKRRWTEKKRGGWHEGRGQGTFESRYELGCRPSARSILRWWGRGIANRGKGRQGVSERVKDEAQRGEWNGSVAAEEAKVGSAGCRGVPKGFAGRRGVERVRRQWGLFGGGGSRGANTVMAPRTTASQAVPSTTPSRCVTRSSRFFYWILLESWRARTCTASVERFARSRTIGCFRNASPWCSEARAIIRRDRSVARTLCRSRDFAALSKGTATPRSFFRQTKPRDSWKNNTRRGNRVR